jgi:hypothetical protein
MDLGPAAIVTDTRGGASELWLEAEQQHPANGTARRS